MNRYIQEQKLYNVEMIGTVKNSDIPSVLSQNDVLILPSIYDGWGAVVNEALTYGLFVICSDRCGAKELLHNFRCGLVYKSGDTKSLCQCMKYCAEHKEEIRDDREYRIDWAAKYISGKVIAEYMIDCLCNVKTERPWMQK